MHSLLFGQWLDMEFNKHDTALSLLVEKKMFVIDTISINVFYAVQAQLGILR